MGTLPQIGMVGYYSEDEDERVVTDMDRLQLQREELELCHVYSVLKEGQITVFAGYMHNKETMATRQMLKDANIPFYEVLEVEIPHQQ